METKPAKFGCYIFFRESGKMYMYEVWSLPPTCSFEHIAFIFISAKSLSTLYEICSFWNVNVERIAYFKLTTLWEWLYNRVGEDVYNIAEYTYLHRLVAKETETVVYEVEAQVWEIPNVWIIY